MRAGAPLVEESIEGLAPTDATVLIWGEGGVERARLARTLHEGSRRRDQPFVTVNCGALPFELLESEIFGYESGAFTGAHRRKPGKIEAAHGGTMFLDEIEALPHLLQTKLLRVLRDGRFSQPGSRAAVQVDVRLVAAAKEDLGQLVLIGRFRADLYRQLKVSSIHLPASPRSTRRPEAVTRPGVAPRAEGASAPRASNGELSEEGDGLKAIARRAALDAERVVLKAVLEQVHWNRLEASRRLKISYKTLRWKIRQYGLDG